MKILLAVDGSPFTEKMLDYLSAHPTFAAQDNQFTALTVLLGLPHRVRAAVGKDAVDAYYMEEADKVLSAVTSRLATAKPDLKVASAFEVGSPGDCIGQVAEAGGYDLVMMGSHGQGALGNLVMGSVATKVLARCTVPVLIVR